MSVEICTDTGTRYCTLTWSLSRRPWVSIGGVIWRPGWDFARRLAAVVVQALACRAYRYSARLLEGLMRSKANVRLLPRHKNQYTSTTRFANFVPLKLCVQDHHPKCQHRAPCAPESTAAATAIFRPIHLRLQCGRGDGITWDE